MQKYDDKANKSGMKIIFMFAQMLVLSVVYIIIYTSFLAVGYAIDQHGVNPVMYAPVVIAFVIFPILLYKYRQMFNAGKMLVATIWMMATASLTIVLLYVYILQMTG
ncbi:MAG: hypothetical protein COA92_01660 [Sulfurovum sp.]|nr:MAG: hypothetical protein COA92_01660 [Sulfurovum sp.]